jgi:hypothetical protein
MQMERCVCIQQRCELVNFALDVFRNFRENVDGKIKLRESR